MQGIPGSGKSTVANLLHYASDVSEETVILSTDYFWSVESGVYHFDVSRLKEAHQWNQDYCREEMARGVPTIIIDNTNIKKSQAQPYFDLAKEFGYEVRVIRVSVALETALAVQQERPENRRVPTANVIRMLAEMEDLFDVFSRA